MSGWDEMAAPTVGAVAVHQVEDPRWHAGFVQHFGEQDGVERRDLGRLQHHRATRRQRRRDLAGDLVDRPVPRRDETAHAGGFPDDARRADVFLELEALEDAQRRQEMPEAGRRLGAVGQGGGRAHLFADRGRHLGDSRLVDVDDALQEVDAFLPRGLRIGVERGDGCRDGPVDVVDIAEGNLADGLLGGGVDHVETLARQRLDPFAAHIELGSVTHLVLPRSVKCSGATYAKPSVIGKRRLKCRRDPPLMCGRLVRRHHAPPTPGVGVGDGDVSRFRGCRSPAIREPCMIPRATPSVVGRDPVEPGIAPCMRRGLHCGGWFFGIRHLRG